MLLEDVDVRIEDEGGVKVVGVPIGTEEYVRGRAMEAVGVGGADCLARCLVNMPDKQVLALIASNPWGRGRATSKGLWTWSCPSKPVEGQTTGRGWRTIK